MSQDDRPTLPERYARAVNSSRLVVVERTRGDVDLLIAAGWVENHLGTMLYRLATEFDSARSEQTAARRRIAVSTAEADDLERSARKLASGHVDGHGAAALKMLAVATMRTEVAHEITSERAFLMMRMKSLDTTKEALGAWAMEQALAVRFKSPGRLPTDAGPAQPLRMRQWRNAVRERADIVAKLTGRVLDVFLDNLCAPCQGRGFNGGFGGPQRLCRACAATGKRSANLGGDQATESFGRLLLCEMEGMLDGVDRTMRKYLSETTTA